MRVCDEPAPAAPRRAQVDLSIDTPMRLAELLLQEEGFAADGYTFHALLRACAGAADVPRAQRVLTRMLDARVTPAPKHFHELLRTCARAQVHRHATPPAPSTKKGPNKLNLSQWCVGSKVN